MKRIKSTLNLVSAISLLLGVIWLSPAVAAGPPTFASLGQVTAEEMKLPGAMDVDSLGNLYVADARGGLVHKFDQYGRLLQSFDLQCSGRGLAVTPDGTRLYVAQKQEVVVADAADGSVLGVLDGAEVGGPEFLTVGEIDLDAFGNVFVVDADLTQMLVKIYNSSWQYQNRFGGVGVDNGQFNRIGGMSIDSAGRVVVADASALNGKVQVFAIDANFNASVVAAYSKDSAANFGSPIMHAPRGLAFDAEGRGYILDFISTQIRAFDAGFAYLNAYTAKGYSVGKLNNVIDVAFDAVNSRLFVGCDTGRVEILGIDGGQSPVYVNHAPTTPVPQSPTAGSVVLSSTPSLVINNATDEDGDALTYQVAVYKDGEVVFEAAVAENGASSTTIDIDVALKENEVFSWTAQAFDGETSSAVSAPVSFVVDAIEEAPGAPELAFPTLGEAINGQDALAWGESVDPDPNDKSISYLVELALDDNFEDVVFAETVSETALLLSSLAVYGDLIDDNGVTLYYWRVTAMDADQTKSDPSAAGLFVYDTTVLQIAANMPEAKVYVSGNHAYAGQFVGVAPVELRDIDPGVLSVVVERTGFERYVAQVSVGEQQNVDLYAELAPAMVVESLNLDTKGVNGREGLAVTGPAAPFLVDFDNDNDLDLLVGKADGVTLFANMRLEGRSRLYFDQGVDLELPVLSGAKPFVADWNNDGRKDLLVGTADGTVTLFENLGLEGAPAFGQGENLTVGGGVLAAGSGAAPVVVDYNSDGAKDLLVGNDAGQLLVYLNQSGDAVPVLAEPAVVLQVDGPVVPFSVDWDADGTKELLVSCKGIVTVYSVVAGEYQAQQQFKQRRADFVAAFPIDLSGFGKQLLVGLADGKIALLKGSSEVTVPSFRLALQDKVDELAALVTADLSDDVAVIASLVEVGNYEEAASALTVLMSVLPEGDAQASAGELLLLL